GCLEARWECQAACHDCLARREPRAHGFDYMVGPWRPRGRQAGEPMALRVEGGTVRGRQRLRSEGRWDAAQRLWHSHQRVAEAMGEPDGVRMFEETGFEKKGPDAVGVARQSCGTWGKVDHGQVGGCAA